MSNHTSVTCPDCGLTRQMSRHSARAIEREGLAGRCHKCGSGHAVKPDFRQVHPKGYVYIRVYSGDEAAFATAARKSTSRDGQWRVVLEHRAVMARMLGRPLASHEEVHHMNGVRGDNRPENLELWSTSQPYGQRVIDKLRWAEELIALYSGQSWLWEDIEERETA